MRRHKREYGSKRNIRFKFIVYGIVAAIAIGIGSLVYGAITSPAPTMGPVGSAHDHVGIALFVNGESFDFSQGKYQIQSRVTHFEDGNGSIIHKHATGVKLGFFLNTLGIKLDGSCISLDDGREFCNEGDNTLKFYVNGQKSEFYDEYSLADNDRVLISYGDETEEEINEQLATIQSLQSG